MAGLSPASLVTTCNIRRSRGSVSWSFARSAAMSTAPCSGSPAAGTCRACGSCSASASVSGTRRAAPILNRPPVRATWGSPEGGQTAAADSAMLRAAERRMSAATWSLSAQVATSGAKEASTAGRSVRGYSLPGRPGIGPNISSARARSAADPPRRPSKARTAASRPARPIQAPPPQSPSRWPQPSALRQLSRSVPTAIMPVPAATTTPGRRPSAPMYAVTASAANASRVTPSSRSRADGSSVRSSSPSVARPAAPTATAPSSPTPASAISCRARGSSCSSR